MDLMDGGGSMMMTVGMLVAMLALSYFLLIRPQKKREQQANEMRNALRIGDVVTTIGGIIGIVTSIKEDMLVLETGSDRNKVRVKKWAIQSVESEEGSSSAK